MIIVGGVYHELCRDPHTNELFGSGARAAFALSNAPEPPLLRSAATSDDASLIGAMGIRLDVIERSESIRFVYDTPLSAPTHDFAHTGSALESIEAEADALLVFGMIDARPRVRAERLVIDPQRPGLSRLRNHMDWTTDRLAIVGNLWEIRGLAGNPTASARTAGELVRSAYSAEVVVVKCGPRGALVVDQAGTSFIPPYPTDSVWPIGAGDVFSALFAWSWAQHENRATDAALSASMAAASWCAGPPLQVLSKKGEVVRPPGSAARHHVHQEDPAGTKVRVYLAGPYFNYGERWLVDLLREALTELGAEVFSPFHDVGTGPPDKVAPADLLGLRDSDVVLALLDGLDSGTLFEVGYAQAIGVPVVGISNDTTSAHLTMLIGTNVPIYSELASAAYRAIWEGLA